MVFLLSHSVAMQQEGPLRLSAPSSSVPAMSRWLPASTPGLCLFPHSPHLATHGSLPPPGPRLQASHGPATRKFFISSDTPHTLCFSLCFNDPLGVLIPCLDPSLPAVTGLSSATVPFLKPPLPAPSPRLRFPVCAPLCHRSLVLPHRHSLCSRHP